MHFKNISFVFFLAVICSCSTNKIVPQKPPEKAVPAPQKKETPAVQEGQASVYSDKFHGKKTASGQTFSQHELTAASKEHELGSRLKVTNKKTGKSTTVTVTDRGPYTKGRIIDLSKSAAQEIDMPHNGVAEVKVEKIQ